MGFPKVPLRIVLRLKREVTSERMLISFRLWKVGLSKQRKKTELHFPPSPPPPTPPIIMWSVGRRFDGSTDFHHRKKERTKEGGGREYRPMDEPSTIPRRTERLTERQRPTEPAFAEEAKMELTSVHAPCSLRGRHRTGA